MCLPRRPTSSIRPLRRAAANCRGGFSGASPGRISWALTMVRPAMSARRWRVTISTSGSSGIGSNRWSVAGERVAALLLSFDLENPDRRRQLLTVGRRLLNLLRDIHATRHKAKGGEALTVGVAFAAVIQLGLIADADEEIRSRRIRS